MLRKEKKRKGDAALFCCLKLVNSPAFHQKRAASPFSSLINSFGDDIAAIGKTNVGIHDITDTLNRGGKVIALVDGNHWVQITKVFSRDGKNIARIFDSGRGGFYNQLFDSFFTRMGAINEIISIFK